MRLCNSLTTQRYIGYNKSLSISWSNSNGEMKMNLLSKSLLNIANSNTVLGFETVGDGNWSVWDRYLTIEGKRAYHIGNICETCAFFFERLGGANQSVSPSEVSGELKQGLKELDSTFLNKVMKIIPAGQYQVSLLKIVPQLVKLGSKADYFVSEQVDLWGIDSFWGLPYSPKIEYYRGQTVALSERDQLFEFIIPMFPKHWLHHQEIEGYTKRMQEMKSIPTALVLSVLDVKQPSDWDGDPTITRHYCLAHYLIEGHHKTYAASQLDKPITILSFLAIDKSIALEQDIKRVTDMLVNS